jgi:peptidoglycan/LPS O-acetylase OafA/YrhL
LPLPVHRERIEYRPDIDGLRAVAVVPVILFHLGVPYLGGGYIGVDVFFVISGFLITSLIAPEVTQDKFSVLKFYERRIRRIFPALFVMTACTLPLAFALLLPTALRHYGESLVGMTLFASNFVFWHEAGYFDAGSHSKPLLHTWSLAVEEQFYIFFPLLLLLLGRLAKNRQKLVLAGLGLGSLAWSVWLVSRDPTAAFYGPHVRAWELLAGCLLALSARPNLGVVVSNIGAAMGLGLILYAVFGFTSTTPFPGWNALFPVAGTALVIRFGNHSTWLAGPLLRAGPTVFIGKVSYSAYLWHWPIIVFSTYYLVRDLNPWEMVAAGLITFTLSIASWCWIEQPARTVRISRIGIFAAAGAAIAMLLPVGLAAHAARGFPGRFLIDPEPLGVEAYGVDVCHLWRKPASAWNEATCTFQSPAHTAAPKVILWGDSFAAHYFPGLLVLQKTVPFTLIHASMSSCAPLPRSKDEARLATVECDAFNERIFALIQHEKPNLVIFAGRWDYGLSLRARERIAFVLSHLKADGIQVIVVGESPVFSTSIPQTFVMNKIRGIHDTAFKPENTFRTDPTLRKLSNDNDAQFFSPHPFLCTSMRCKIFDGQLLYWDEAHFSVHGSTRMVGIMAPLLKTAFRKTEATKARPL